MADHPSQPSAQTPSRQADDALGGERVAKALARAGVASRREVERLIAERRVALNGAVLETPAVKVAPGDRLTVDGALVAEAEPTRLWRYHKPAGLLTTNSDPKGRPTVFEALPDGLPRVISVGRLDLNSEGLLLLTNDGALARALELPANAWVRRYRARAFGRITQAQLAALKDGITVEGVIYGPIEARLDKVQHRADERGGSRDAPANVWITLALAEGKNREVRRVLEALSLKVNRLIRLAYGPFALATLPPGAVEEVGPRVIREQLTAHIAPDNLPTGNAAATNGPMLARPAAASTPRPGATRSQGRLGAASAGAGEAILAKPIYKPGWARPKPPRPGGAPASARAGVDKPKRAPGEKRKPGDKPPRPTGALGRLAGKRPAKAGGFKSGGSGPSLARPNGVRPNGVKPDGARPSGARGGAKPGGAGRPRGKGGAPPRGR